MMDALSKLPHQLPVVWRALILLPSAAVLAGVLGFVRPIRRQALTIGLAAGHGLLLLSTVLCAFVIGVLWVLESVAVPLDQRVEKLTKMIRKLDGRDTTSIEWRMKKQKADR